MRRLGLVWLAVISIIATLSLPAQVHTVSGVVLEAGSGTPLPFVNIWITATPLGTSTNTDGGFEIKIPHAFVDGQHTLSFSNIGYHSKKMAIEAFVDKDPLTVYLKASVTNLSGVVVISEKIKKKNANKARRLVQQALIKIPKNYPKLPYSLNTFYRHYCSENDNYVRLIEAAIDVYSPKNDFENEEVPDERLAYKITQLRRSFDFTENSKIFHPPISLNFLWANDITDFEYHNPLTEPLINYDFQVIDTTNLDSETLYIVDFEDNREGSLRPQTHYRGKLFILKKSLAFVRAEVDELKEKIGLRDSVNSLVQKIATFKSFENKFYIDRLTSDVNVYHATKDSNNVVVDTLRHRSHIEMIANNIRSQSPPVFEGKEPRKHDLRKILYDSTFWIEYTVLKETKLEAKIIKDLSEKISLNQQFQAFNTIDGGGISIVESPGFKELISLHSGTPLYVVLWSNWGQLNYLDLEPVSYFKRMLKKDKVKLILVAVEENEQDWLNNRKFYGLDHPSFQHERLSLGFDSELAQSYFNNVFPYFLSIDKLGKIIPQEPPLPNKEEIKPYLKSLIRNNYITDQ